MNPDPDYSAAYVILETDGDHEGHGLTFTLGRGNELCVAAIESLAPLVVGCSLKEIVSDMGAFWRHVTGDSQLRWVGPDKIRESFTSLPAQWSTQCGTSGPVTQASPYGSL